MENHTQDGQALNGENLNHEAVEQLYAGKFKSKEALLDSAAELVSKVEGRQLSPSEVLRLSQMEDQELTGYYKGLERSFHSPSRPRAVEVSQETVDDPVNEVAPILDKYMESRGYVRKEELERERYEQEQLNVYLSTDPSAEGRLELIKTLAQTPQFKDKNYAEVDDFIKQHLSGGAKASKPSVMGLKSEEPKSISEMSDEEFSQLIGLNRRGYSLRKSK